VNHYDPVLAMLLWQIAQNHPDGNVRGRLFEYLIGYLFRTLFGYRPRFRLQAIDGETDILLEREGGWHVLHEELGNYVLAECKNTQSPLDAAGVKKFASTVRSASCRAGVLASVAGLTGNAHQAAYARFTARKLYHRDSIILLVLDGTTIQAILNGQTTLAEALRRAYEAIRFDLPF
jgi:hypothetical protein